MSHRNHLQWMCARFAAALGGIAAATASAASPPYFGPGWVNYGVTTHPLNLSSTPQNTGVQNTWIAYDPAKAWRSNDAGSYSTSSGFNTTPNGKFDGYDFLDSTPTDSAAAATAISTGVKTFNNAINWSDFNATITPTILEKAKNTYGKATGTISTVPFSHATPAGLSNAHDVSRNDYVGIANQMLDGAVLDVIMGAGNPDFTDDNAARTPSGTNWDYVGGQTTWNALKAGTHAGGWSLLQSKTAFESLMTGATPNRVVGVAQVATTLQEKRAGLSTKTDAPLVKPLNLNVPTLEVMARGALNALKNRDQATGNHGFFLHIEGGAVDWASHDNHLGRMIEEQMAFNKAVNAVVDYINQAGDAYDWSNTTLIVTADHETGRLWGPNSGTVAFDGLVNKGAGVMPGGAYNSTGHSNALVPVYAFGDHAGDLAGLVDGVDATAAAKWGIAGSYVDNTDLFTVMSNAMADGNNVVLMIADGAGFNSYYAASMYESGVPEPAGVCVLAMAAAGGLLSRRRRGA